MTQGPPRLILMSGVPLSGKTTLARAIVAAADGPVLHVENDRLRPRVVDALGRTQPTFDEEERERTYATAWQRCEEGLETGAVVVHDATNLTEDTREHAYARADRHGASVLVVFVQTPAEERDRRAREAGPAAERAHAALGDDVPAPERCSRPWIAVDGRGDPDRLAARVLARSGSSPPGDDPRASAENP